MKKYYLLPFCLCLLASTSCQKQEDRLIGRQVTMTGPVIASVNGINIYARELQLLLDARQKVSQPMTREAAIDELINVEIVRQQALTEGVHLDQTVAAKMNRQSIQVLVTEAIRQFMESQVISEQDLFSAYNEYTAGLSKQEYKVRHILAKTKPEAINNIDDLTKGAAFAELAQKRSIDSSSEKGGDLGWVTPRNFVQPLVNALLALQPGEFTKEPVQTQFGWHILLLEETRPTAIPEIDSVKKELKTVVMNRRIKLHVDVLRKNARIAFNKPAVEAAKPEAPAAPGKSG